MNGSRAGVVLLALLLLGGCSTTSFYVRGKGIVGSTAAMATMPRLEKIVCRGADEIHRRTKTQVTEVYFEGSTPIPVLDAYAAGEGTCYRYK